MSYDRQIQKLVHNFIDELQELFSEEVQARVTKSIAVKLSRPKKKKKMKTKVDMRCRHTNKNGDRCENPSTGPRFHYLCKDHR